MTLPTADRSKRIRDMVLTIGRNTLAFRGILSAYVMVLAISGTVFAVYLNYPNLNSILGDSRSTPWGVFTSIFVHWDLSHILTNMIALFFSMFLFAFCNCISKNRKRIESLFLASSFLSAIISNIVWLLVTSNTAAGASGLVYATQGNLVGFSLFNGLQILDFSKLKRQRRLIVFMVLANLVISIFFIIQIMTATASFLNVGQGVNVLAHGFSFLSCFLTSVVWFLFGKMASILE